MAVFSIAGSKFEIGAVVALKATDFIAADFTTPMTGAKEVGERYRRKLVMAGQAAF